MPAERKPISPLLLLGMILLPAGIVSDSFLHLPQIVTLVLLGGALVCMFLGVRAMWRQQRGAPTTPFDQRHKRFIILLLSLVLGFIGGYFLIRHDHPEFSITLRVTICLFGLVLATSIIAWQIYFRGEKPNT